MVGHADFLYLLLLLDSESFEFILAVVPLADTALNLHFIPFAEIEEASRISNFDEHFT
jgi:hypothetical protein